MIIIDVRIKGRYLTTLFSGANNKQWINLILYACLSGS